MTMTDPVADFLTRIRNAIMAKHAAVEIPASNLKVRLAEILKAEGFIEDYQKLDDRKQGVVRIELKWLSPKKCAITSLQRESRPGRRVYVRSGDVPHVRHGHGIGIISTSRGVMTDAEARRQGVGGEVVCSVY